MNEKVSRSGEISWTSQRRRGESFKLVAGFCAATALLSAVLYAGSGRTYEKFAPSRPAGESLSR